jgi:hypothetical protein
MSERLPQTARERMQMTRDRKKKNMSCEIIELKHTERRNVVWLYGKKSDAVDSASTRAALYEFFDDIGLAEWSSAYGNRDAIKEAIRAYFKRLFPTSSAVQR